MLAQNGAAYLIAPAGSYAEFPEVLGSRMAVDVGMVVVMPMLMMIVYFDRHHVDPSVPNFGLGH